MMNDSQLEPDLQPAYDAWTKQPTKATTGALLKQLGPSIDRGLQMYAGRDAGPTTRSRAKQMALQAMRTYDPKRAKLGTHVVNHLQGLRRAVRQEQQIIRTPERVAYDQAYLNRIGEELTDRLGREPTDAELADYGGLSLPRIAKLRRHSAPMSEGFFADDEELPQSTSLKPSDRLRYITQLVYEDLGPRDQQILEWTTGLNYKPKLDNRTIASKLGITPGAVSQRKALIQQQLDAAQQSSVF